MKQLDEMERMANDIRREYDGRRLRALQDDYVLPTDDKENLARALLAVMPTIRAALDWHRVNTGQHTNGPQHTLAMRDTRLALVDAIVDLRRRLGGE